MKINRLIIIVALFLYSCSTSERMVETETNPESMSGTWELTKYIPAGENEYTQYPENIIYRKVITGTHFTWVYYDKETNVLVGSGGGTYTYDGEKYKENIRFFYPPGSSILGQAIPFTVDMKDGQWLMKGYAREAEFDLDTGDMMVTDSTLIQEMWAKVD